MSTEQQPNFRPGNKALDYLISHFQPLTAKAKAVTDGLPRIAGGLYGDAQDDAKRLLRQHASEIVPDSQPGLLRAAKGLVGLISGASARKEKGLADCIFDLQLTSVFTELSTYT